MKQTAYRAALAQLADAIAQQDPANRMRAEEITSDLFRALERRHPDIAKAMDQEFEVNRQRRKQCN